MELFGWVKKLEFVRAVVFSYDNAAKILMTVGIDMAFFLAALLSGKMAASYLDISPGPLMLTQAVLLDLLYLLFLLSLYSFFKWCVLEVLKTGILKRGFSMERLGRFFLLNIAIFMVMLATSWIAAFILANAKEGFALPVLLVVVIPYLVLAYVFLNSAHSAFSSGLNIRESLRSGISHAKSRRMYLGIILPSVILIALLSIPYSLLYIWLSMTPYAAAIMYVFEAIIYIVFVISRTGFYLAVARGAK